MALFIFKMLIKPMAYINRLIPELFGVLWASIPGLGERYSGVFGGRGFISGKFI